MMKLLLLIVRIFERRFVGVDEGEVDIICLI